jgi:cell division protease FtsH
MVTEYGMSARLGAVKYGQTDGEPFLGRTMGHERNYSEKVAADIDGEVRALIELAHDEAWEILVEYRDVLDNIVEELMEKETISQADMARICARVVKRPPMAPYNGNGRRAHREQPTVPTTDLDGLRMPPTAEEAAQAHAGAGGSASSTGEGQH